jgi:hypothetical protein
MKYDHETHLVESLSNPIDLHWCSVFSAFDVYQERNNNHATHTAIVEVSCFSHKSILNLQDSSAVHHQPHRRRRSTHILHAQLQSSSSVETIEKRGGSSQRVIIK